jgi:hypothetical protein
MIATLAHAVTVIAAQVSHLVAFIPGTIFPPPIN